PPVDYSLLPPWLVFVIVFVALSLLGLVVWLIAKRRKPTPPKLPRQIALEELDRIGREIERMSPYQFSIRVSDILRKYVTQQYGLPATRQTSLDMTNLLDWWLANSALTFARPWLLLLLLAIPLLAWLCGKRGPAAALTYSSTATLQAIGKRSAARAGKILRTLLLASLAILVVGLARPQLGKSLTQIEASGIDIMLVLDVSGSMLT